MSKDILKRVQLFKRYDKRLGMWCRVVQFSRGCERQLASLVHQYPFYRRFFDEDTGTFVSAEDMNRLIRHCNNPDTVWEKAGGSHENE